MEPSPEVLFDAIDDGDVQAVADLVRGRRGLLAARDDGGLTPLLRAAVGLVRDPALIEALVSAGADPRSTTEEGETALHLLVDVEGDAGFGEEPLALLRPLVEAGADLEARQADGLTPLALAVVHGTPDEVAAFCALGADVGLLLPEGEALGPLGGRTLLGAALGSPDKVEALLAHGADPGVRDGQGRTASELCAALEAEARRDDAGDYADALGRCGELLSARARG